MDTQWAIDTAQLELLLLGHQRILTREEVHKLLARDGLLLVQITSQLMELELVLLEDLQSAIVRVLDQLSDNRVHTLGRTGAQVSDVS